MNNDLCEYCKCQPETIFHLFIEREKVKQFWNILTIWLNDNSNMFISLDAKNILFAYEDKNILRNYIFVVARYYIYANKFSQKDLNLNSFLPMLKG